MSDPRFKPSPVPLACIRKPDSESAGRSPYSYCMREIGRQEFAFEAHAWKHVTDNYRKGRSRAVEACEVCCERVLEAQPNVATQPMAYRGNEGR